MRRHSPTSRFPFGGCAQGGLPRLLVGREGIPLRRGSLLGDARSPLRRSSLLGDAEVHAIHGHRAVIEHVVRAQPALEHEKTPGAQ